MRCKYYFERMNLVKSACEELYKQKGCSAGGPLHILLDDNNIDNEHILFCLEECKKLSMGKIRELGEFICHMYLRMRKRERIIFDWYWMGNNLECSDTTRCSFDEECDLLKGDY